MKHSDPCSPRASRAAAKLGPAVQARTRIESGDRISRRQAWITDPHALLRALEQAESAERGRLAPPADDVVQLVSVREPAPSESRMCAPPPPAALRADERVGRASDDGVLVIIRRRRAA
jgi:hypothetical protein